MAAFQARSHQHYQRFSIRKPEITWLLKQQGEYISNFSHSFTEEVKQFLNIQPYAFSASFHLSYYCNALILHKSLLTVVVLPLPLSFSHLPILQFGKYPWSISHFHLLPLQTLTFPSTRAVTSHMLHFPLFHITLLTKSWSKTSIYFCSHRLFPVSISASLIDLFCALQFLPVQNYIRLPKGTRFSWSERLVEKSLEILL